MNNIFIFRLFSKRSKIFLYQFEKREVFGDFGERIALGRKEEIIR